MARSRSPWRALRGVLMAGGAALTWLTLSATAATADTPSDPSSLLGGVTSSVSAVTDKVLSTALPVPAPEQPSGVLHPVVGSVSSQADDLVASVPVINRVVPRGTVSTITVPIAELADQASAGVVETVVPPVAEAVPVLEPVLNPVADLVAGTTPLPVPALPGLVGDVGGLPGPGPAESTATVTVPTADIAGTVEGSGPVLVPASEPSSLDPSAADVLVQSAGTRLGGSVLTAGPALSRPVTVVLPGSAGSPVPVNPAPSPPVPGAPGVSGTGSGVSSPAGGGSGAAAWLNSFDFYLPLAGSSRAGDLPAHVPSPVSYDPGSSPD